MLFVLQHMITREQLHTLIEANRTEPAGVRINDNVEVWAFADGGPHHVRLRELRRLIVGVAFDDIYNLVTGRTDFALAQTLEPLCDDILVALRFATP